MLASVACLGVIFLAGYLAVVYHHMALTREDMANMRQAVLALRAQVADAERAAQTSTRVCLLAETAMLAAQRAEEEALAARALVNDVRPTRQA